MSTLQNKGQTASAPPAAKVTPSKPDPETVTISGYVVDESYGPGPAPHGVQAIDPANPNNPHTRIGEAGQFVKTGGCVSTTVTRITQLTVLLLVSVTTNETMVTPTGKLKGERWD